MLEFGLCTFSFGSSLNYLARRLKLVINISRRSSRLDVAFMLHSLLRVFIAPLSSEIREIHCASLLSNYFQCKHEVNLGIILLHSKVKPALMPSRLE